MGINTGLTCVSLLNPSSSSSQSLFLWQYYTSRANPSPSQQCKWLLMAGNVWDVWAVYCCFDKLRGAWTAVRAQNNRMTVQQCENHETGPPALLISTCKHSEGERAGRWRCCHLKVASVMSSAGVLPHPEGRTHSPSSRVCVTAVISHLSVRQWPLR